MKTIVSKLLLITFILFIIFVHIWQINSLPRGLYVDESSIGLNAALVAETGYDEHRVFLPVYFEAFGEYKNPLYIYATAIIFKILGVSVFNLRLTSFVFISIFLFGLFIFLKNLIKNELVALYGLLVGGTLPWFFNLSRIGFEVISQPAIIIFCLIFVYKTYSNKEKHKFFYPLISGVLIGISVYSFSTARLLSFLFLLTILLIYFKQIKKNLALIFGFLVSLIPYISFSISNPSKLTSRFHVVTYIFDRHLSSYNKVSEFFTNYFHYLSPTYLFINGDTMIRHHNPYGGEMFLAVVILSMIGLYWLFLVRKIDKFSMLLVLNSILSPLAAALTTGDSSLRTILIGLYLLIFSAYGLNYLLNLNSKIVKTTSLFCLSLLLFFEITGYLRNYFIVYPQKTVWAFESYDFPSSLQIALNQHPADIIVSSQANEPYAHLEFYEKTLHIKSKIPISVGIPIASPNRCIIYFTWSENILNENMYHYKQFGNPSNVTQLRCFYD